MRVLALAIFATFTALTAPRALAQAYDVEYPVCLQAYGDKGGYIDCRYTSLAQCAQAASGRSAQCNANPNYRGSRRSLERADRRQRRE
jgi:Protein of unknown function (DUF3551)